MNFELLQFNQQALNSGMIIGLAASLMLLLNGRIAGVSGILSEALKFRYLDFWWRLSFLLGLMIGGYFFYIQNNEVIIFQKHMHWLVKLLAGFLVGFGVSMGKGCTSGHGICGLGRFSRQSFMAVVCFITFGMLTVYLMKVYL